MRNSIHDFFVAVFGWILRIISFLFLLWVLIVVLLWLGTRFAERQTEEAVRTVSRYTSTFWRAVVGDRSAEYYVEDKQENEEAARHYKLEAVKAGIRAKHALAAEQELVMAANRERQPWDSFNIAVRTAEGDPTDATVFVSENGQLETYSLAAGQMLRYKAVPHADYELRAQSKATEKFSPPMTIGDWTMERAPGPFFLYLGEGG